MKPRPLSLIPVLVLVLVAALGCERAAGPALKYHCPMHPTMISDQPGDCPICGMRLVPASGLVPPPAATPSPGGERRVLFYRNPMNPAVTSPAPAKDEMGMDFVPVYADEAASPAGVEGLAPVTVADDAQRLAGIQTELAQRGHVERTLRTVGMVVPDETRIHHVHTKTEGWIEKLHVNFTGQLVRRGDPVLDIYSPELVASQEEYLKARAMAQRFAGSALDEVRKGGADLVAAARRRLLNFDVPEDFVAELERRGTPQRTVTLYSHSTGYVTSKSSLEGQRIEPGQELFTITDLSRVWIEAEIYEYEAQAARLGATATVSLSYDPSTRLEGKVSYLYPTMNPETRTLRVRFEFANPGLKLKPAMYADVDLRVSEGEGIVVPDAAVMDTGSRQVVFVETGPGQYAPREVRVGVRSGGRAQLLMGVAEGERVVIHANFLLDSESRLRAAVGGAATTPAPAGPQP